MQLLEGRKLGVKPLFAFVFLSYFLVKKKTFSRRIWYAGMYVYAFVCYTNQIRATINANSQSDHRF